MKILNLYAGLGGNRQRWEGDITAVEIDPKIAKVYADFFPNDTVIVGDAHKYLLDHFREYDFIWSSPPCPTHSDIKRMAVHAGYQEPYYSDMALYQEIILLTHFAPLETRWVVENVKPYYKPLIPAKELHRHLFWTNFDITYRDIDDDRELHKKIHNASTVYGVNLKDYQVDDKRRLLRNMVNPELGLYILNEAFNKPTNTVEQLSLL